MDRFYDAPQDTETDWKELFREADGLGFTRCDVLDCSKSFKRESAEKSMEDILKMMDDSRFIHNAFIIRGKHAGMKRHIEVGTRVAVGRTSVDYFIFVRLDMKHLTRLVRKFKLTRRENDDE